MPLIVTRSEAAVHYEPVRRNGACPRVPTVPTKLALGSEAEVDVDRVDGRSDERRSPSLELRLANFDDECPIRHHGRIGAASRRTGPGRDQARQR